MREGLLARGVAISAMVVLRGEVCQLSETSAETTSGLFAGPGFRGPKTSFDACIRALLDSRQGIARPPSPVAVLVAYVQRQGYLVGSGAFHFPLFGGVER